MVSKVWFNTIWLVVGKSERREKLWNKAWLHAIHPPYYTGHGRALSLGHWSLRFGVCTPLYESVNLRDEGDVFVYSTMAHILDTEAQEINKWDSSPRNGESESQASSVQQTEHQVLVD